MKLQPIEVVLVEVPARGDGASLLPLLENHSGLTVSRCTSEAALSDATGNVVVFHLTGSAAETLANFHRWSPLVGNRPTVAVIEASAHVVADELVAGGAYEILFEHEVGAGTLGAALRYTLRLWQREVDQWDGMVSQSVLDSLSSHIALVGEDGEILFVNAAWDAFAKANGANGMSSTSLGANYFEVCRSATGPCSEESEPALEGMLAVLGGQRPAYELEYPCHAPDEDRWFLMRITPFQRAGRRGVVVAHTNTTHQRQATIAQAEATAEAEAEVERTAQQVREMSSLDRLSTPPKNGSGVGVKPLEASAPRLFHEIVTEYERLLEIAFERHTFKTNQSFGDELRNLAHMLGAVQAGPRDVIDFHTVALRNKMVGLPSRKAQVYAEEGRMVVLELMGYLVSYYRTNVATGMQSGSSGRPHL